MPLTIHAIQTGSVRVKRAQARRKPGGLARVLTDSHWTDWLPILAWVIDHPEGPIVVDTGETSRTQDPSYYPRWHPFFKWAVRMNVRPEDEIGPKLRELGVDPASVRTVVLTHFHTDHAGGLHHFPKAEIFVSRSDHLAASGFSGTIQGFLPHRWPGWLNPFPIDFLPEGFGAFDRSFPITKAGDVLVVPTPGHTPGHISVVARKDGLDYFLAGDTSYSQALLLQRESDGVSPRPSVTIETIGRILDHASHHPTVYLPSHDPESEARLSRRLTLRTES
jgi:glyoxylase-like metal-dependent hydrolase (beta-lactamase superfamily II)